MANTVIKGLWDGKWKYDGIKIKAHKTFFGKLPQGTSDKSWFVRNWVFGI